MSFRFHDLGTQSTDVRLDDNVNGHGGKCSAGGGGAAAGGGGGVGGETVTEAFNLTTKSPEDQYEKPDKH